ncbi:MAG: helix-turn-helix domain-containing protein [Nitrosopumilus sp.]|nr:helix-turn-helix domain-containing protein [Nitrosopumilus sp.]
MRTIIKIHGCKSIEEQITNEIHNLITGKGSRPYPLSITETAKTLGVSRETVYQYIRKMKGDKSIQKTSSGKLLLPKESVESKFCRFSSFNPFTCSNFTSSLIVL